MIAYWSPAGKVLEMSAMAARILSPVESALEPGRWNTASTIEMSRSR